MLHVIEDSLMDSVKLVPFLFLAYLAMEYLEHSAGKGMQKWLWRADKAAPVIGGLLGAVPQCGFSAAAANLYAGRVISLGTLAAVFLSTSDEMLPILISERAPVGTVAGILLAKAAFGIAAGLVIGKRAAGGRQVFPMSAGRRVVIAKREFSARPCPIPHRFSSLFCWFRLR